jgi:MFS family permease
LLALTFGYLAVDTYDDVLAMGVLLGIAGASFGVALSLGSGWFPPKYKGLAMGIAGAGNSGTVLAVLFAPPLALKFGWQAVYGIAACTMLLPMVVMWIVWPRNRPTVEHQTLREHIGLPVREGRLGLQPDLHHHLRRLHRPGQLPAHLLLRPVQGHQGRSRPADHAGHA